jgi:hypothetical protein
MIDLKTHILETLTSGLKEAGFTVRTPQKVQKENTQITGTVTFLPHSNKASLKKKEEK